MSHYQESLGIFNRAVTNLHNAETSGAFQLIAAGVFTAIVGIHHPVESERLKAEEVKASLSEALASKYAVRKDGADVLSKRGRNYLNVTMRAYYWTAKKGTNFLASFFDSPDTAAARGRLIAEMRRELGSTFDELELALTGKQSSGNANKKGADAKMQTALKAARAEGLGAISEETARQLLSLLMETHAGLFDGLSERLAEEQAARDAAAQVEQLADMQAGIAGREAA